MTNPIILKVYDGGKLKLARAFREGRVRIGTAAVDLVLEGEGIAPHHAVIELGAMGPIIRALSASPLYVNGQPVLAAPLRNGDLLTVGELRVMVELRATAQAPAQPPQGPRPRLQLIQGDEAADRASLAHAVPPLAVVREAEAGEATALLVDAAPDPTAIQDALSSLEPELPAASAQPSAPPSAEKEQAAAAPAPSDPAIPAALEEASIDTPAAMSDGEASGAQIEMFWGDTRLSVWQLEPGEQLLAGEGPGCAALLRGIERVAVVRSEPQGWKLCVPRPLSLALRENGVTVGGAELLARGRGGAGRDGLELPLPADAVGFISAGDVHLRVRRVKLAARAPKEPQDWKGVLAASIAAVLFVGLMRVLSHAIPLPVRPAPMPEVIRPRPMVVRAAVKPVDPATPRERARAQGRRDPGRAVARHAGLEGQAGSPTAPRRNARAERKADEHAIVANAGLLKALGAGKGAHDLFGTALERGARDALGHLTGPRVADARGNGGMGLRSLGGTGGGGDGSGLGLARIGTNGIGGGLASYGEGKGGLKGKADAEIGLAPGQPQVVGHIDPELIRKVVHDHRAQIRTCYEMQLTSRPNLAGKLVAAWTIDAQGGVVEAHTQESALHDRTVENCVASKIKTWRFPLPKGGGEVFVTYPFIFTPGG